MVQHNKKKGKLLIFFLLLFTLYTTVVLEVTGPKRDSTEGQGKRDEGVQR